MASSDSLKKKRILWASLTALLLCVALWFCQALTMPKYMGSIREGALTAEYYTAESTHDVLFVGDCEVYETYSPVTLWNEYGISSYIRGSAQQLVWQSYYLLEDAFLSGDRPSVVVFNVYALRYGEPQSESYNRMTLDGMRFSKSKIEAVRASMTEEESFLSYLFPLLRFHSRIGELGKEDFTYLFRRDPVSYNGYLMQTGVKPKTEELEPASPVPDAPISDTAFGYLDRMHALCQSYGATLVLVKAPTDNWKYHWYDEWEEQVLSYAESKNLSYYNLIGRDGEIGLDWSTDTYDAGVHLNVYGVEKLSRYFGKILREEFGVPDRRDNKELSAVYQNLTARYETEKNGNS